MPIQIANGSWQQPENDLDAVMRFQQILLSAVEGARGGDIDLEYQAYRRAIMDEPDYSDKVPKFVRSHRDLESMWPFLKNFDPSWEPRRKMVRGKIESLINTSEQKTYPPQHTNKRRTDASNWTGIQNAKQRLVAIKTLGPVAQASIDTLIATLEEPNHNGAPPLDEHKNAIANLKELHRKLGELLELEDENLLSSQLGSGLLAEIAIYGKRAARELRNDPLPYAMSGLLLSSLTVFGAPGIAAYMAGVAINIRKTQTR